MEHEDDSRFSEIHMAGMVGRLFVHSTGRSEGGGYESSEEDSGISDDEDAVKDYDQELKRGILWNK